jgi:hypothetical protein
MPQEFPANSFIDLLNRYGAANPPSLVYRRGDDFKEWREAFTEKLESLRGPVPDRVEPEVEVISSQKLEDHTRHLINISVSEISSLPAYLLVPNDIGPNERRPGLIVSHGHLETGIDGICGVHDTTEGEGLSPVKAGYVVLAPAWWGWPTRDGHLDAVGARDRCNVIQMAAEMYGMNVLDLHLQDGQAALDVLASRAEVDAERLGCIGNSYGGRTTMWLSIFDQRIKVCVPAGCMNTFRERSLKLSSCGIQYLPGILQFGDVAELFSLIAPRPMQLQVGAVDPLITPSDRDDIERIVRNAYRQLDAESNLDYHIHSGGHVMEWEPISEFLSKHL